MKQALLILLLVIGVASVFSASVVSADEGVEIDRLLDRAEALIDQEAWDEADRVLQDALKVGPNDLRLHRERAALLLTMGRFEEAKTQAERGLMIDEDDVDLLEALSGAQISLRQFQDAELTLTRWLGALPEGDSPIEVLYRRGLVREIELFDFEASVADFRKVYALLGEADDDREWMRADVRWRLASALHYAGELDEARELVLPLVRQYAHVPRFVRTLAYVEYDRLDFEAAVFRFRQVRELQIQQPEDMTDFDSVRIHLALLRLDKPRLAYLDTNNYLEQRLGGAEGIGVARDEMVAEGGGWPLELLKFLRGDFDEAGLLARADEPGDATVRADRRSEAHFVIGSRHLALSDERSAIKHLQASIHHSPWNFLEIHSAMAELDALLAE